MFEQLVHSSLETTEAPLVCRQDFVDIEVTNAAERVEEIGERIHRLLNVDCNARADAREHVIATEEQSTPSIVKADMPWRVARSVQRHEVPAGNRHRGAVLEENIRLGRGDELANAHGRGGQLCAHLVGNAPALLPSDKASRQSRGQG